MSIQEQAPETDLWLPLPPNGAEIDPHTIHTHYFGFSIPEANLGGFIYIRYQPAFPLSQGGVCIFRGMDNMEILMSTIWTGRTRCAGRESRAPQSPRHTAYRWSFS